jgi:hypothetical protein
VLARRCCWRAAPPHPRRCQRREAQGQAPEQVQHRALIVARVADAGSVVGVLTCPGAVAPLSELGLAVAGLVDLLRPAKSLEAGLAGAGGLRTSNGMPPVVLAFPVGDDPGSSISAFNAPAIKP